MITNSQLKRHGPFLVDKELFFTYKTMNLKVYIYKNCSTCKNALQFLDAHSVSYTALPIRETPPTKAELKRMKKFLGGDLRKLFNTSGMDYRQLNLKDKLPDMSVDEAIDLLNSNGNLIKRPFALSSDGGMVGFKEAGWKSFLGIA